MSEAVAVQELVPTVPVTVKIGVIVGWVVGAARVAEATLVLSWVEMQSVTEEPAVADVAPRGSAGSTASVPVVALDPGVVVHAPVSTQSLTATDGARAFPATPDAEIA